MSTPARRELSLAFVEAALAASRHARRAANSSVPADRTQPQLQLARVIDENPGTSVQGAATALSLAPNTISTLVGQLVDAGWVERHTAPNDRRVVQLHLTSTGAREMRAWRERGADALEDVMGATVERLGEERVTQAVEVLQLVASLLQEEHTGA